MKLRILPVLLAACMICTAAAGAAGTPADVSGDTAVYCVPEDGKYYHLDPECQAASLLEYCCTYAELEQEPYSRLLPCEACSVPMERTEETPYASFWAVRKTADAVSYTGSFCVADVRRDGEYYRVVARFDETAKALYDEQAAVDCGKDPEKYIAATEKLCDYCNALPVSYEEKITAVPLSREELDVLAGKRVEELLQAGFLPAGYSCGEDGTAVFDLQYGFYGYRFFADLSPEEFRERAEKGDFSDVAVKGAEVSGISPEALGLEYRANGTPVPNEENN